MNIFFDFPFLLFSIINFDQSQIYENWKDK